MTDPTPHQDDLSGAPLRRAELLRLRSVHVEGSDYRAIVDRAISLIARITALAEQLDIMANDRQAWADHPEIGGRKPPLEAHLRGKRYGYSHAAQLIRGALAGAE